MSDIAPISSGPLARIGPASVGRASSSVRAEAAPSRRGTDQVEVSDMAYYMSQLRSLPPVRQDLIDQVRSQVEAGTYETPQKIDAAIEAMFDDLTS
ncbi:MAG: flagellar biosynthesis anti-sigma factor FlgM [Phycisphaerales bacterium]|nr:flagellar biosynthesis anti-sigma factor FlgM [Phycisphaerales bacterium]